MNPSSTRTAGRPAILLNQLRTFFSKPHNVILLLMGIVLTVTTVAPIVAIVEDTFKIHAGTIDAHLTGKASGYTLVNYIDLFTSRLARTNLWTPLLNTLWLAAGTCVVSILYGGLFASGWIPTFATVLTVQVFVIFYGSDLKKVATSLILGTIVTCPVCYALLYGIVSPLGLPLFIAVSAGVAIVVPVCSLIFRLMPWMTIPAPAEGANPTDQNKSKFFVHQIFGDIGQLTIWGSSWATIGMYVGGIISWVMNPLHPAYGSGNFPLLIMVQVVTGALAILIWYPKWKKTGMAFTFAGIVFASAVVSTYPPSWAIVIPTILIGAVVFAPLVEWVLKVFRFKGTYHPICLIQVAIFTVCTAWSFAVMYLIMPMLA